MSHNTYTIMVLPKTVTVDFFGLYEYDIDNLIKKNLNKTGSINWLQIQMLGLFWLYDS